MSWKSFLKQLSAEYKKDKVNDAAGALTYFGVLALFPFLLFLVSLASVIIQPTQAQTLIDQLGTTAPPEVTKILGDQLRKLAADNSVGLLSVGAVGALWAASGGVVAVMRALNTAYNVEESRPFWKVRGTALLFVLGGGALGLIGTLAAVATPAIARAIGGPAQTVLVWLRLPVAALIVMFVWACAYYFLPDVKQRFKFITPGSVVGVLAWLLASWGFSLYVGNFGKYDATYGSLGGVIVFLLWMWISSQVLLLGAEINAIIEHRSSEGKAPGEKVEGERAPGAGWGKRTGAARRHPKLQPATLEAEAQTQAAAERERTFTSGRPALDPRAQALALARGARRWERPEERDRRSKRKVATGAFWGALLGAVLLARGRRTA